MKIAKVLKIGGIKYKVIEAEEWLDRNGADGETFYDKRIGNVIYIYSGLTQQAKEVTLIHEILHCLNSTLNHEFLDSLAEQLYQVFNDNKLLR